MGKKNRRGSKSSSMLSDSDMKALMKVTTTYEDSALANWIPAHIKGRVCNKFTPKNIEGSDPLCFCGYLKSKHSKTARQNYVQNEEEWKVNQHTVPRPTNAFGEMEFSSYGGRISKYVKVDSLSDMSTVITLLMEKWKLHKPNLLISVTGGAKDFSMKPRLKNVFRRGLMKAAESTGAWIITGGTHAGVMKHVGEAVRDYKTAHGNKTNVVAIGIAPWGVVSNKELLIKASGQWPADYKTEVHPSHSSTCGLDPNHSHFLLVDNGTQHKFAVEIPFRASLESMVSKMKTSTSNSTPIVCLALEGGPGTLETVKSAIQSGTPAVIVEGSGKTADIIAYAYDQSQENEIEVTDKLGKKHKRLITITNNEVWEQVRKMIYSEWGDKDIERRLLWVKECLQKRDHITVFRLEGSNSARDIDVAILQALLKVNKDHKIEQLKLALAWNRIDVAQSEIFTDDSKWEKEDLYEVMHTALLENRVDFVKLFLENGVSIRDFLTPKELLRLYNEIPENCLLHKMLTKRKEKKRKRFITFVEVGELIEDLMGEFFSAYYTDPNHPYRRLDADQLLADTLKVPEVPGPAEPPPRDVDEVDQAIEAEDYGLSVQQRPSWNKLGLAKGVQAFKNKRGAAKEPPIEFEEPARDLFLWSVLMSRLDMSKFFWEESKEGIAAALTAQKLLRSLQHKTDDTELIKELVTQAGYFEELSVGVLSECHAIDDSKAQLLLIRCMPGYGKTTNVSLATQADNKRFIAHGACQSLLTTIWKGKLATENNLLTLWMCIFFPPLIFLLVKFRDDARPKNKPSMQEQNNPVHKYQREPTMHQGESPTRPQTAGVPGTLRRRKTTQALTRERTLVRKETVHRGLRAKSAKPRPRQPAFIRERNISYLWQFFYFYNAPIIIFFVNCIFYLCFLALFSVVLLTEFRESIDIKEIILHFWAATIFAEELREILSDQSTNLTQKIKSYLAEMWNILDIATFVLYVTGLVLRFIPDCSSCLTAGRIILSINLMMFIYKTLHIFSIHKELGPKLVMIGRMLRDLAFFVVILMVFIVAYGLAAQIILYPNSDLGWTLLRDVIRKPYWQMYGELFLEEIEGDPDYACSDDPLLYGNGTLPRCPAKVGTEVVPILLGFYILITNVLMLNLLIAMFSYTFDKIQSRTDLFWYYQRYFLIKKYHERPPLPPPFIIICHIYLLAKTLFLQCCGVCVDSDTYFKKTLADPSAEKQLILWENIHADEYVRKVEVNAKQQMEYKVCDTADRVDTLMHKVDEMSESTMKMQVVDQNAASECKLPPALGDRLMYLEEQHRRTAKALDWIIKSMVETGQASKKGPPDLPDVDVLRDVAKKKKVEEAKKKKEEFQHMLERQLQLHMKARTAQYPSKKITYRFNVPDDKVLWDVDWPDYAPIQFQDKRILGDDRPPYADIDLLEFPPAERPQLPFNQLDKEADCDRRSAAEEEYKVVDGLPLNPHGRTGLFGRGKLGRWGPNWAGDPVVTRWKRDKEGKPVVDEGGKKVLEFVAVMRTDNEQWAIPGGFLDDTEQPVHKHLRADFSEEALGTLLSDKDIRNQMQASLDRLFKDGHEIYRGYVDDPRNTDNAWIETISINYHDETGDINFQIRAGERTDNVRWQKISHKQPLYGVHLMLLQKVAERHDAAF